MTTAFVATRRVEFSDTDAAGIMHFAAFFRMMEQAEHELLRSVGLSVHEPGSNIGWPRAHAKCDFRSAARFEDVLRIEVQVLRLGNRSVTYGHRFLRGGELLAEGQITAVCCRMAEGQTPESMPIPSTFAEKLLAFVAS